jgi:hypothetical protein
MLFVLLIEYLDIEDKPESVKKEFILYETKDVDELKKILMKLKNYNLQSVG